MTFFGQKFYGGVSGKRGDSGFTLIELIMVVVILGILMGAALPRLVSMSTKAQTGVGEGIAAAIGGAAVLGYAGNAADGNPNPLYPACGDIINEEIKTTGGAVIDEQTTCGADGANDITGKIDGQNCSWNYSGGIVDATDTSRGDSLMPGEAKFIGCG